MMDTAAAAAAELLAPLLPVAVAFAVQGVAVCALLQTSMRLNEPIPHKRTEPTGLIARFWGF